MLLHWAWVGFQLHGHIFNLLHLSSLRGFLRCLKTLANMDAILTPTPSYHI